MPQSKAEENTYITINYISEENDNEINIETTIDQDNQAVLLIDFENEGTEDWQHSDIIEEKISYEATFAGWKLVSINNTTIDEEYIYPDNDYIYLNDEPYASFSENITELQFEALWGKTVYVRDQYNFVDIQNIYGYNVEEATGDILTAKIYWDTSVVYSSDENSGATKEEPVATIEKAYELLENSYGGKICVVNHITLEAPESYQSYSESFTNKSQTYVFGLGDNLNIQGVVTITGEGLGSGIEVENKANAGNTYEDSYIYVKNTRGAGTYNGTTYTSGSIQLRFYTNSVLESLGFVAYRENYNSNGARQTGDCIIYNTANKRLVIEESFKGYKRTTTQNNLGLEAGNFSHTAITETVNGNSVKFVALSSGANGCTHIYGSTSSYTKDGTTYKVSESDNIYLTLRGGISWYNIMGISASAITEISNLHVNIDSLSVSNLYGIYSKEVTAKDITINLDNVKIGTTLSSSYNAGITADNINLIMKGENTQTIATVYAGGYNINTSGAMTQIDAKINVKVDGAKITNLYGGGNQVATLVLGELNINVLNGTISNLYGGGLGGYIGSSESKTNINIDISGGTIKYLYGGGSGGFVSLYESNSPTDLSSYTQNGQYIYNSSNKYYITTKSTYSSTSTRYNDTKFRIKEYSVKSGTTVINTYTSISAEIVYPKGTDTALSNYYRSSYEYTVSDALVNGDITINLNDGAKVSNDVYGGGKNGAVNGDITIKVADGAQISGNIYGGGEGLESTILGTICGIDFMWTNSQEDKVVDISKFEEACVLEDTIFSLAPEEGNYTTKFLIGSEIKEKFLQTDGYIYVYSETISKLGLIDGNTSIEIEGGTIDTIYGGSNGSVASVSGNTEVLIQNGTINNVYGGGNAGEVLNTKIVINNGTINENVYGGGNVAQVNENTEIYISSGTFTDIFGGGNQSYVTGNTTVNVGDEKNSGITVTGLVYGGGRGYDVDNDGDASDFTTVYGSSEVNIQGTNTEVENYGSIKLGAVEGDVDLTFKDYWTGNNTSKYKTMNGIDRATIVTFDNSYVLLENKDANGNLEGIKAIGTLVIPNGSGLKISANGEISKDFIGGGEIYLDSEVCLTVGGDISGVTKLILNPMLFADTNINLIKGGIDNPYLKVAGSSQATYTETAAVEIISGESRYDILAKKQDEDGITYSYYYIAQDINITDFVKITSYTTTGKVFSSEVKNTTGIKINEKQNFTTDISLHYELLADEANPDKYTNLSRELILKISEETFETIPKGTEILMIKDGKYYSYIVKEETNKILLSDFEDISGQAFSEETNMRIAEGVTSETNETTQSVTYRYDEEYKFILDFKNAESSIPVGTYYMMININDNSTWIKEEQMENANTIEIKNAIYEYSYELDKEKYEASGTINITGTLKVQTIINEERNLFIVAKLTDENGNNVDIPTGSKLILNNQEYVKIQNGIAQIKVIENLENTEIVQDMKLSLDMSEVLKQNMLQNGNYNLILEFVLAQDEVLEGTVREGFEISITIQNNRENTAKYGLKASLVEKSENEQLINKNGDESRTVNLEYNSELLNSPTVKIKALEKTGAFEYTSTENANKITYLINGNEITEITDELNGQQITLNFGKEIKSGTYKIVFELYDNQENKLTESCINFIVIE